MAHLSVISSILFIFSLNIEIHTDLLSVSSVVGKYECLVMMSLDTLATDVTVASTKG